MPGKQRTKQQGEEAKDVATTPVPGQAISNSAKYLMHRWIAFLIALACTLSVEPMLLVNAVWRDCSFAQKLFTWATDFFCKLYNYT